MTVRRAVAAADMAAGPAEAQMHPRRTDLQALLTAEALGVTSRMPAACTHSSAIRASQQSQALRRRRRFALDRCEARPRRRCPFTIGELLEEHKTIFSTI